MMLRARLNPLHVVLALTGLTLGAAEAAQPPFDWQRDYARVTATGDIQWTPRPFSFVAGDSIRYIDFENGSDRNTGTSKERAWKHHPWDSAATGRARAARGIHTYVFKGGVFYRGMLTVAEGGRPGNPIRLTRDPSWGEGPAVICGSERVSSWRRGADHPDIPDPASVWYADLDFTPRTVWLVAADGGDATRIPLARTPNWTYSNPDDMKEEWWRWTNEPHPFQNEAGNRNVGYDSKNITGRSPDYFQGALIWPEFGWVMGGPYPTPVERVDVEKHSLAFSGWTGGGSGGIIFRNMRYYLEDKPHYLDDPNGEFWFHKKGNGGRLYLRLPDGVDPNQARIEAGKRRDLIYGNVVNHLDISGLDFRFTTPAWNLTVVAWDFSTRPWGFREDAHPACIRVWGEGRGIRIANCRFRDVTFPIRLRALEGTKEIADVVIEDNAFLNADGGVLSVTGGIGWGFARRHGRVGDVRVYRNRSRETGMRPSRYGNGTVMNFGAPRTLHVAGNVIERSGAQGINVVGGKSSGMWGDVPFTRILIHQNKVWQSMLYCNDFGGIEAWQSGPTYIFNNLSHDARGMWAGRLKTQGSTPGFGHAYYLDGGFKNYLFNNIAWGRSNDPTSKLVNCSAFQEIHSFQNAFFNNTAFNYYVGSRRQAPVAGRNKYLGNVWQDISKRVFRHADPAKTAAAGNAADAGPQQETFHYETNAYARNVFYDVAELGVFEASGRWLQSLEDFRQALRRRRSLAWEVGVMDDVAPLRDPAAGDFRLNSGSAAVDNGVRVFVPWTLSGVVGEWHFHAAGDDPTRIIDEHWYMADYYTDRTTYHDMPRYPLKAVNVDAGDYVSGELEDWTRSALTFAAARQQYAVASHQHMSQPITFRARRRSRHEGSQPEEFTVDGEALKTPQIHRSNMLVEVYFKARPGSRGIIASKMKGSGYDLRLNEHGCAEFTLRAADNDTASVASKTRLADGRWHHLIVEADRAARTLTVYVDGRRDASARGLGPVLLANEGDLYVGGSPTGGFLDATFDFLRIAQGTLADAQTSIEELYAWQFDGPQLRDFAGAPPLGSARDAGAIESH